MVHGLRRVLTVKSPAPRRASIEPERYEQTECGTAIRVSSATILAINPDGTVRYRVTVAEP